MSRCSGGPQCKRPNFRNCVASKRTSEPRPQGAQRVRRRKLYGERLMKIPPSLYVATAVIAVVFGSSWPSSGQSEPVPTSSCASAQYRWQRGRDTAFCADRCTNDFQCAPYEKCHIMGRAKNLGKVRGPKKFKIEYTSDRPLKEGEFGLCDPFYVEPSVSPGPAIAPPGPPGAKVDAMTPGEQASIETANKQTGSPQ